MINLNHLIFPKNTALTHLTVFCHFQDSLEGVLVATHQEMELYRNQPLAMEKLQLKKESLQNKLINIRGELSQASSVRNQTIVHCYENTI